MAMIKKDDLLKVYTNVLYTLRTLGAEGRYILTGSGAYVGVYNAIKEEEHPIHDLDIKLIPDDFVKSASILWALSRISGKELPDPEYVVATPSPRFDFVYNNIPVNVWVLTSKDDVHYQAHTNLCDETIFTEDLVDIFKYKAMMNRPKDVRDAEIFELGWREKRRLNPENDITINPYVLIKSEPLSEEEIACIDRIEVVNSVYSEASLCFHLTDENRDYQGMSFVQLLDSGDYIIGSIIDPHKVVINTYRRVEGFGTCRRAFIK